MMKIDLKEVGLVFFAGAIGGLLSLVYSLTVGKPPLIDGIWLAIPAYMFLGSGTGYLGVYVLARTDTRHVTHCLSCVFHEGVHVADRTRYSDQLLMFRLKALAPEKYRERKQVEVKEAPVTVVLPDNGRGS